MKAANKRFYKTIIHLALPMAIQQLVLMSVNMADTLMVGRLGEQHIAAVGIANKYYYIIFTLYVAINSTASIFISRAFGNKNNLALKNAFCFSGLLGTSIGLIASLFTIAFPQLILRIFTNDPVVISLGVGYLRIVAISYVFIALTSTFSYALKSIGNAKTGMRVSLLALIINIILNYLLIFTAGLGVIGAAIATVLARLAEVMLLARYIYRTDSLLKISLGDFKNITREFMTDYIRVLLPVGMNDIIWVVGISMYMVAYGKLGTEAIAAVNISENVQNVFFSFSIGLSQAAAVIIGNVIGKEGPKRAQYYATRFIRIGVVVGSICGLILFLLAPIIIGFFNLSEEVRLLSLRTLYVTAVFINIRTVALILIIGILRSGGDVKYSMYAEGFSIWAIGVPLAFIGTMVFKLDIYFVVLLVSLEELIKTAIVMKRIVSKKWIHRLTTR
ncbi:MAG: MATE family efflux transporter [Peptostreptococcales bacterium]